MRAVSILLGLTMLWLNVGLETRCKLKSIVHNIVCITGHTYKLFLADRTNGQAYVTVLRASVCL